MQTSMDKQGSKASHSNTDNNATAQIPDGFVLALTPEGQHCIVPEYLVPATHLAFEGYRNRRDLNVGDQQGGVSIFSLRFVPTRSRSRDRPYLVRPRPTLIGLGFNQHKSVAADADISASAPIGPSLKPMPRYIEIYFPSHQPASQF